MKNHNTEPDFVGTKTKGNVTTLSMSILAALSFRKQQQEQMMVMLLMMMMMMKGKELNLLKNLLKDICILLSAFARRKYDQNCPSFYSVRHL